MATWVERSTMDPDYVPPSGSLTPADLLPPESAGRVRAAEATGHTLGCTCRTCDAVGADEAEWGWAVPDGQPVVMRDEAQARDMAARYPGSTMHTRYVAPWVKVVNTRG